MTLSGRVESKLLAALILALCLDPASMEAQSGLAERHAREGIRLAQEGGDLSTSEARLQEAVRLAPTNVSYLAALGGVLAIQQKFAEASRHFGEALRLQPDNLALRRNLAASEWQQGLLDAAKANLDRVLLANPRDQPTILLLGIVTAELQRCPQALDLLESVMPLVRQRAEATLALAKCSYQIGNSAKGREALEDLLGKTDLPGIVFQGAAEAAQAGDFETALHLFSAIRRRYNDRLTLLYNIAYCQYRTSRFREARTTLGELLDGGPAGSDVYSLLGWSYRQEGRLEDAVQAFRMGIAVDPGNESNYLDLATALMDDKRNPAALSVMKGATQAIPASKLLLEMRGLLETTLGHYIDAVKTYSQASQLDPGDPDTWLSLAKSQAAAGEIDASYETLATGIQRFPKHAPHYVEYGRLLLAYGSAEGDSVRERADSLFREAIALDGNSADARYEAGKLEFERGEFEHAIRYLEKAAKLSPSRSVIQLTLARAYVRSGKPEEAAEARRRFQSLKSEEDAANPRQYGHRRTLPGAGIAHGGTR